MLRHPVVLVVALCIAAPRAAAQETLLLRQPSVSERHIAFAYASNIWIVDRAGGQARRLTSFQGTTAQPRLSPDGRTVAFTGTYAGNADVYTVPVEGGEPTRLTWHPGADLATGWTPDGQRVVFASGRQSSAPTATQRFWTVAVTGGPEAPMPMPRAFQGHINAAGTHVAYRMASSWDDERRNYRGGQNKPIWVLDLKSFALDTIPRLVNSKELDPAWVGDDVFFLSDRDGVQNVWKYESRTRAVSQVTRFADFDVKTLEAGGGAVVFEQAGRLHLLDPRTGRAAPVSITVRGDFPWMMPQWRDVSSRITSLALSPTGRRALVEARGEIFTIPAEKGDVRNLSHASGSAERAPAWSPDGRLVSWFSDASGEYRLVIAPQDGAGEPRSIALPGMSFPYTPSWSPDSRRILFTDVALRLWVVDVASGAVKQYAGDAFMVPERSMNPVWSPDSKWIAFARRLSTYYRAIVVLDTETGEMRQVTDGLADATSPAWDASGKYLWFLASTDFALRSQWLDMTSYERPRTNALYLAVLRAGEPTPFTPESDDEPAVPPAPVPAVFPATGGTTPAVPVPATVPPRTPVVAIDFDGLARRIIAVPAVASRDYALLKAGVAGTVYFWENVEASGTAEPAAPGGPVHRYTLKDRKAVAYATGVTAYAVSADGRKLLYRTGGAQPALVLVDATAATPPAPGTGRLTAPLRMWWDPRLEYAQIFEEARRKVRDYFYVPNLHGTDWPKVVAQYRQFVPFVAHRTDLNYLLDWMGSELAIGHSYVNGGDFPEVPAATGGLLGADMVVNEGRYRFTRIYDAESWNPELRAPLAAPGIEVRAGDYLLAINGVELRGTDNVFRLLDGTANRQVVITVNSRPVMDGARRYTVVPVANDQGLRTRAWVEGNRRIVDSLSGGRLAYVHLPNTGQGGYSQFNRYYFAQQNRQGAVVDERYNGGGSAADYIIELLGRDFDGYFNNPVGDRTPFASPSAGIWGPKVMIINEMAGSGGDLMPYMFRRRRIGPLVGTRTWGGLVATSDQAPFVDGGGMVAPRLGFFDRDGKWAVENEGVGPDIEVENFPRDVIAGRDPQLERAVQEALRLLAANPVRLMKEPPGATWGRRPR
ncbi:MAG: PD40 domain-containing protein [Gemmatimonadaceae bacterium]|nr:PD40 domain-containing protein [Gemmatimonadaceae bacterium]